MNKIIFLFVAGCAFIALSQVQCDVHVVTKVVTANTTETEKKSDQDEIELKVHIPVITDILNKGLTVVAKLLRKAIDILRPISPHGADALDSILSRIEDAVENLTSVKGIPNLIKELIGIVEDALKAAEGILEDVGGDAGKIVKKLQSVLEDVLKGLHLVGNLAHDI